MPRFGFALSRALLRASKLKRIWCYCYTILLAGTDSGVGPFFSPDGQWIGFFADGKLKKISVLGGAALALCDAPNGRGASWGEGGDIIAALGGNPGTGLSRVPAAGGAPQTLTKPLDNGEAYHRWPKVLPGGNAVLFSANKRTTALGGRELGGREY
jgi:serine/threonine-protein kinase